MQKPTLDEVFLAITGHGAEDETTDDHRRPHPGGDPMTTTCSTERAAQVPRPRRSPPARRCATPSTRPWRWPGAPLKKMRRNPEQLFDVTHPAAAVHRDVRLHLRRRDLRQRRRLPADHHPRHPRPDRAHRLHGDRHPAARGHGQGRLRPVQVAADRPDRAAGRPGARRPAALRHRRHADHPDRHADGLPPRRRRARRARRHGC